MVSWCKNKERVLIDGQQLKPILDRTAYVESFILRNLFTYKPNLRLSIWKTTPAAIPTSTPCRLPIVISIGV